MIGGPTNWKRAGRMVTIGVALAVPLLWFIWFVTEYTVEPGPVMGLPAEEQGKWKVVRAKK